MAYADATLIERIQATLDGVARGINALGKKAEDFVGPGLGLDAEETASFVEKRTFTERYPVGPSPRVAVSNEFGSIRVETWDNRLVEVSAEISVGAETASLAAEVARTIDVNVSPAEDQLEVRTYLPASRRDAGSVSIAVNYTITVPSSAAVSADNFFGDTHIRGVGGRVTVEAQYGAVELQSLSGPVNVRSHGDFPVRVSGLSQGGSFQMHGARAEFSNVRGALKITNFRGAVSLRDLAPEVEVDVVNDSGPIDLLLPTGANPDLTTTVIYGAILSDLPLTRTTQGSRILARNPSPEAAQRIALSATFGDVRIAVQGQETETPARLDGGAKPYNDILTSSETVGPGMSLVVDAAVGDVRIEPAAGDAVRITATRIVWAPSAQIAPAALEALGLTIQRDTGRVSVTTVVTADLEAMGCPAWRTDLLIQIPQGMPIVVNAQKGLTTISNLSNAVQVNQVAGAIQAVGLVGEANLSNQRGDITATGCAGPMEASVRFGVLRIEEAGGRISASTIQGRTIIDAPLGPVTVRATAGDVRILALEGIGGDYDVLVEQGDLNMLLAPGSSAALSVTTQGGIVKSAHDLSGNLTRDTQAFLGRLGAGAFTVRLEARNGNIVLD